MAWWHAYKPRVLKDIPCADWLVTDVPAIKLIRRQTSLCSFDNAIQEEALSGHVEFKIERKEDNSFKFNDVMLAVGLLSDIAEVIYL